ncbi:prenyltransferase, partial [Streptomyces sp. 378]|nr:prenyltransferase [Streptomyces sp. 378]
PTGSRAARRPWQDRAAPLATATATGPTGSRAARRPWQDRAAPLATTTATGPTGSRAARRPWQDRAAPLATALGAAYAATTARPYVHATLNPSPPLTQRAVGAGIRATIPLQAALCARSRDTASALLIAALAPLGARFAKKVSVT